MHTVTTGANVILDSERMTNNHDVLSVENGVSFEYMGKFVPNVQSFFIHIHVVWPELVLPDDAVLLNIDLLCSDSRDLAIIQICADYAPLLSNLASQINIYRSRLQGKLNEIAIFMESIKFDAEKSNNVSRVKVRKSKKSRRSRR